MGQQDVLQKIKGQMSAIAWERSTLTDLKFWEVSGWGQFNGYLPRFWSQMAQVLILPQPLNLCNLRET